MDTQPPHKHLLLTVGATATFPALVHLLTKPALLTDLHRRGFTHIHVQTGPASSQSWLDVFLAEMQLAEAAYRMHIEVFPHKDSLCDDMVLCQACVDSRPPRTQGLILAHAGTGTVLDAWRVGVPIIIYPNPSLLDNHQDELAAEIERQDYGIRGNLEDPVGDLARLDALLKRNETRWPPHGVHAVAVLWDHAAALLDNGGPVQVRDAADLNLD